MHLEIVTEADLPLDLEEVIVVEAEAVVGLDNKTIKFMWPDLASEPQNKI